MARKKVRLEYIQNDTARRVTYRKRVKGIVKKTRELSVLCGVDACAVIYGPYDQAPVVWPSTEDATKRILLEYKLKSKMDQSERNLDQQTYLQQSVAKAEEKVEKILRKNRELEMGNLTSELLSGKPVEQVSLSNVPDLLWVIEDKLRTIQHRFRVLEGTNNPPEPSVDYGGSNNLNPYNIGQGFMGGINTLMGETAPWMMQAGPSMHQSH